MVNLSENGRLQIDLYDAEQLHYQQRALLAVCRAACNDRSLSVSTSDLSEVLGILECMMLDDMQTIRALKPEN